MSKRHGMTAEYYDCMCFDPEHVLRFVYDDEADDGFEELSIEIHLAPRRWPVRLWHAIRHVFGYRSRYGDFGSWSLHEEDVDRLMEMLEKVKARKEMQGAIIADLEAQLAHKDIELSDCERSIRDLIKNQDDMGVLNDRIKDLEAQLAEAREDNLRLSETLANESGGGGNRNGAKRKPRAKEAE